MKRLYKVRIVVCILTTLLLFQSFSIKSYAMSPQNVPKNFLELTFEERYAWVSEHVEGEFIQGTIVNNAVTRTPIDPVNRLIYTAHRDSYLMEEGTNNPMYKLGVTYSWSVASDGSKDSISIDFIDVEDWVYVNYNVLNEPVITKGINTTIGYGFCEVKGGFLKTLVYYDLFQYATLYYNGSTHFRTLGNSTTVIQ